MSHAAGWLVNLPAFLLAVFVLVTVHEFGHFWVARRLGFKVLRFSVGFGRPLWTRHIGADRTELVLAAIPLGGYVKLLDEREGPVASAELHRAFTRRPHWQRIAVLLAGPAANFVLAILFMAGTLMISGREIMPPVVSQVTAGSLFQQAGLRQGDTFVSVGGKQVQSIDEVGLGLIDGLSATAPLQLAVRGSDGSERALQVALANDAERRKLSDARAIESLLGFHFLGPPVQTLLTQIDDGPARRAGLQDGDEIRAVNGAPVRDPDALVAVLRAHPDDSLQLLVARGGKEMTVSVLVAGEIVAGQRVGRIHAGVGARVIPGQNWARMQRLGPLDALTAATAKAWELTALQAKLLWRMLFGQVSVRNISGPLTIAQFAGESALAGVGPFISYLVFVSLALGFMNLLPIPILDGGQIVLQAFEWLKGRPLSERAQIVGQQLGIALVVLLLGIALFNDFARQFG